MVFNIAEICDKAGRSVNQDNFWVCPDVAAFIAGGSVAADGAADVVLSDKGALLVVADGMGGMNAGEVASQIVVDSLKRSFSDLDSVALDDSGSVKDFIRQAIVEADGEIKKYAAAHPETEGMGSTVVLAWLLGETVYVGWCGDSRAYCYNPANGLVRLSHDHSYVQELVDSNKISEEHAFNHPNSNIITRSLGDSGEKARPEVREYPLHSDDMFLLCSDGLCGLLRDEEIESILSRNRRSVEDSLNALWRRGQEEGWTDNVTIELAKVASGGIKPTEEPEGYDISRKFSSSPGVAEERKAPRRRKYLLLILVIVAFAIGAVLGGIASSRIHVEKESIPESIDSLLSNQPNTQQYEKMLSELRDTLSQYSADIYKLTRERNSLMEKQKNYEDTLAKRQKQIDSLQNLLQKGAQDDSITVTSVNQ